jgi:hypothetical protein
VGCLRQCPKPGDTQLPDTSYCFTKLLSGKILKTDGDSPFKRSHSGVSFDGQRNIKKLSIYLVFVAMLAPYTPLIRA